ncbi:MAG: stage II sporulation protein R [Faecalibacterium sp.]
MKKNLQAGLAYLIQWAKVRILPNRTTDLRGLCPRAKYSHKAAQCLHKVAPCQCKARGQSGEISTRPNAAQRQRALLLCLGLGLCLAFALSTQIQAQLAFAETCADIRSDTLRLHIQANSNSVADQAVKLQVRDAILAEIELLYAQQSQGNAEDIAAQDTALAADDSPSATAQSVQGVEDAAEQTQGTAQAESSTQPPDKGSATALVLQNIPRLALAASKALTAAGVQQQVNITLETRYFSTTVYDTFTLPAGQYSALCVTLGQAQGKNWWCVLYPSLCLASASGEYTAPAENDIICGDYALRFAVVEWWQKTVTDSDAV